MGEEIRRGSRATWGDLQHLFRVEEGTIAAPAKGLENSGAKNTIWGWGVLATRPVTDLTARRKSTR